MSLTFQQGTKLYLATAPDTAYVFQVSEATASQTFQESKQVKKTIHSPIQVARTFVTEKTPASLQFEINVDYSGVCESKLLDWFGLEKELTKYKLDALAVPKKLDMYIETNNTVYKVVGAVAENLEMALSRKEVLSWSVSATGEDLIEVTLPTFSFLYYQDSSKFFNGALVVSGSSNVVGATFQVTRSVEWLKNKSIHDIGSIYKVSTPTLKDMALSGKITKNKVDSTNTYNPDTAITMTYGSSFKIHMDSCNTTDRWEMSDIHKLITDYKYLSGEAYIEF